MIVVLGLVTVVVAWRHHRKHGGSPPLSFLGRLPGRMRGPETF